MNKTRAREIGIRIALDAPRGKVIGTVVGRAMALTALGIGLGTLGSLAASIPALRAARIDPVTTMRE